MSVSDDAVQLMKHTLSSFLFSFDLVLLCSLRLSTALFVTAVRKRSASSIMCVPAAGRDPPSVPPQPQTPAAPQWQRRRQRRRSSTARRTCTEPLNLNDLYATAMSWARLFGANLPDLKERLSGLL